MRPGNLLLNKPPGRWWRGGKSRVVEVPLGPNDSLQWVTDYPFETHELYDPLEEKPPAYLTLADLGEKALELRLKASLERWGSGRGVNLEDWRSGRGIFPLAPTKEEEKRFLEFTERYGPLWFPETPRSWQYKRALPKPEPGYEDHLERQYAGFPLYEAVNEAIRMAVAVRCYQVIEGEGGGKALATLRRWLKAIEESEFSGIKNYLPLPETSPSSSKDWKNYWDKVLSSLLTTEQGLKDAAEDWLVGQLNSHHALGEISPRLETAAGFPRLLLRRHPDLVPKSEMKVKWGPTYWFRSLAGALWLHLFLSIVQGNPVRECLSCGTLFEVTGRRDQVYCDHWCRGSANAKSYYQRKKRRRQ